jgi:hypothetical protein
VRLFSQSSKKRIYEYSKCKNVFIDGGSNVGDTVKKFIMGPTVFPSSPFAKYAWSPTLPKRPLPPRKDFCIFGFEGNPVFTERLRALENDTAITSQAKLVKFYTQTVISSTPGNITFYLDVVNKGVNFWGSSILETHPAVASSGKVSVTAQSVMLGPFLEEVLGDDYSGTVMIKMDIEGAEFDLLLDMALNGYFCKKDARGNLMIDYLNVEFHNFAQLRFPKRDRITKGDTAILGKLLRWCMKQCGVIYDASTD